MTAVAVPDSRSGGWPWLLTAAGVLLVVAGLIGAERLAVAVFLGIQAANMLFFLRHLMFVAAATRAERQLRATLEDRSAALRYWPRVTVLVPCHTPGVNSVATTATAMPVAAIWLPRTAVRGPVNPLIP